MMRVRAVYRYGLLCALFVSAVLSCRAGGAAAVAQSETQPRQPVFSAELPPVPNKRYRIAVVFSGEYWEFFENFKAVLYGLSSIGLANPVSVPDTIDTGRELCAYIASCGYSSSVDFCEDLFFDLEWGKQPLAGPVPADLILAYGGIAGTVCCVQADEYGIPVLIDAVTDYAILGLTKTAQDSGRDMVSCNIDENRFKRQIALFHALCGFESLGIVYGDDVYGLTYNAVRDIEEMSELLGFRIVRDTAVKEYTDGDTAALYLEAIARVAPQAHAVYIGASTAVTEYDIMRDIAAVLMRHGTPSFALEGSRRVEEGILFSFGSSAFLRSGVHMARKIALVLSGERPRDLAQEFENIPTFALNLETAQAIDFPIPFETLLGADELFPRTAGKYEAEL